ncbi:hypothetical protein CEXT_301991 [Caerostris extrusa]|uniref:Uncharacterized protein n=1 Tax=Caerostris extrusa TaxID=172846 RepID=A0AAV4VHD6_CAEEX|nr:hypothetical protein CEXT_301991 [Caerostris extrusa]
MIFWIPFEINSVVGWLSSSRSSRSCVGGAMMLLDDFYIVTGQDFSQTSCIWKAWKGLTSMVNLTAAS